MIYLLDDKKIRQEGYGWTSERLNLYSEILQPVYNFEFLLENDMSVELFRDDSILLFHESFFDGYESNVDYHRSLELRQMIKSRQSEQPNFLFASFTGSYNTRRQMGSKAFLPVSKLYENLEYFLKKVKEDNADFRYLLYGENPEIEEHLTDWHRNVQLQIGPVVHFENTAKNIFFMSENSFISNPVPVYEKETIYNNEVEDADLSRIVADNLLLSDYDNIFLPLCFGSSLSDFNGLRLALHIRCTNTPNRLKNIFIYGLNEYNLFLDNEFFGILKTKNVYLIDFKREAFKKSIESKYAAIKLLELASEIRKVHLKIPDDFVDNHGVSNEWAIYTWAKQLNALDNDNIQQILKSVGIRIYYKYLQTINQSFEVQSLEKRDLEINFTGSPKILLIDDQADNGWYEILCHLFTDINKVEFYDLHLDYENLPFAQIATNILEHIEREKYDLVILDYRLRQADHSEKDIEKISGLKILKEIKAKLGGVQVIIFSAANNVKTLKSLQAAQVDGFVLKEGVNFTNILNSYTPVYQLLDIVEDRLQYSFTKALFTQCSSVATKLKEYYVEENADYNKFIDNLKTQLTIIVSTIKSINLESSITLDIVFLSCYNYLELFIKYYVIESKDYKFYMGHDSVLISKYEKKEGHLRQCGHLIKTEKSWYQLMTNLVVNYFVFEDISPIKIVDKLWSIKEARNNYIHNDKPAFTIGEVEVIINQVYIITKKLRE